MTPADRDDSKPRALRPSDGRVTVADVVETVLATGEPVFAVSDGSGIRAARAIDLRHAAQRDDAEHRSVLELCDSNLLHLSHAAATQWLGQHPTEAGAVAIADDGSTAHCVPQSSAAIPIDTAIVMAGGRGTRLRPLTDDTPKPLLPVGGRPLIYRILDRLQEHGVRRLFVSVHHLVERVRDALSDGSPWQMQIEFLEESRPLDTGAGLAMLGSIDRPFFITNGDILTSLDLSALGRDHVLSGALATIATYRYPAALPYGVVHRDGPNVRRIEEKPVHRYPVNAGIYAFAPRVLDLVQHAEPLAMVDFLNARAQAEPGSVRSFPLVEYWNDIGTHADYERAQEDVEQL